MILFSYAAERNLFVGISHPLTRILGLAVAINAFPPYSAISIIASYVLFNNQPMDWKQISKFKGDSNRW
jgi:hypothetical protein